MKQVQIDNERQVVGSADKFLDRVQPIEAAYVLCPQGTTVKSNVAPVSIHMSSANPAKTDPLPFVEVETGGIDLLQVREHGG